MSLTPEQAKQLPTYIPNPLLAGLPDYLKDTANYQKVQKALFDILQSHHSHAEQIDFFKCFHCQIKVTDHKDLMLKFGFKSPAQYLEWKKTMNIIINKKRTPLR